MDKDGNRPCRVTLAPFNEATGRLTSPYDRAALDIVIKQYEERAARIRRMPEK